MRLCSLELLPNVIASRLGLQDKLLCLKGCRGWLRIAARHSETVQTPCKVQKGSPQTRKKRLDDLCHGQFPELGKNVIQSWIAQGKVLVNKRVVDKAGAQVSTDANIVVTAKHEKFVCRAGKKLEAALEHFKIDVKGLRVLDSGISTGGFTDCLLQRGAAAVIGVDVGYGQVAEKIRTNTRVTVLERTNLRYLRLEDLPERLPVDMVTLDLSFISVLTVIPDLQALMVPKALLVVLIKPQFEAGRRQVQPGGIVDDPVIHTEVIQKVTNGVQKSGFSCQGVIPSPVPGAKSNNKEFLAFFVRSPE